MPDEKGCGVTARVLRYAAFTVDGQGGNPAGLVGDAARMQAMAADIGYSQTAFLVPRPAEANVYDVRYFSPEGEVPFCGHATIAAAVALFERSLAAELIFHTPAGFVSITTSQSDCGETVAELTNVAPRVSEPAPDLVQAVLIALRWSAEDLDPDYPVRLANAGSEHLVLVTKTRERLADLDYDFDGLEKLMRDHGLVTVQLVWPESKKCYHSRNPFAGRGVVEDSATGASAAAFGGYLRELA
jgi:PhzF family phenazine biosynthesis protein